MTNRRVDVCTRVLSCMFVFLGMHQILGHGPFSACPKQSSANFTASKGTCKHASFEGMLPHCTERSLPIKVHGLVSIRKACSSGGHNCIEWRDLTGSILSAATMNKCYLVPSANVDVNAD